MVRNRAGRIISLLIILLIVTFTTGCVYYNTFYNARQAFNKAEGQRKEKGNRSRINKNEYNTAIDKSLKVIENYPNSKWYDDALFVLGVSYYWTEKYSRAERRFREILANYPESKYAKEAELYLAKAKLQQRDIEDAMEIFKNLFEGDFERDYKAEAAVGLGEYYFEHANYSEAEKYFIAVRDSLGSEYEQLQAQIYIADGRYARFQFGEAAKAYLQVRGQNPDKDQDYHALYRLVQCSYRLQRLDDAFDYLSKLMENDLYYDSLDVLRLTQAEGYLYDEDIEIATDIYELVADEGSISQAKALANYSLGLIYQFEHDDLTKAKEYYDLAVKGGRSTDIYQDALQRSSDIGKLDQYGRTLKIDSTTTQDMIDDAALTQYQLAELFWYKLNKPDTAIIEMQYIIDSLPEAYETPKAMISLGQMVLEYEGDTTKADSLWREVLVRYPHSDYIPEVIDILGISGTEADTGYAEKYVFLAEHYVVDTLILDSARYYYQHVVDNYPDSKYFLQAQFALIWIDEEYASPGDSSVINAYTALIDSFPNSYWGREARKRVEYVPPKKQPEGDSTRGGEEGPAIATSYGSQEAEGGEEEDSVTTYSQALEQVYIGPNGETIPGMPPTMVPIRTEEEFIYPTEAYLEGWEGPIYFQVLLDFSGEVVDHIIKMRSPNEEINIRAEETVASMTFDVTQLPEELEGTYLVYKYMVYKPEHLR